MSLIQNERTKLLATALNNVAVATVITGVIAPSASYLYGLSHPDGGKWWLAVGLAWFTGAVVVHSAAQKILGRLTQ